MCRTCACICPQPPSLDDWLDDDDEARFISEVVEDLLDLAPMYASYGSVSGAPPYDPRMMLKLLLFAYATGVTSSRELVVRQARPVCWSWKALDVAGDRYGVQRVAVGDQLGLLGWGEDAGGQQPVE